MPTVFSIQVRQRAPPLLLSGIGSWPRSAIPSPRWYYRTIGACQLHTNQEPRIILPLNNPLFSWWSNPKPASLNPNPLVRWGQ